MKVNNIEMFIVEQCELKKIKLNIVDKERVVVDGIPCNGFFNYKNGMRIDIAKANKNSFDFNSLLLHEFCHALQYIEKDIDELVDEWLNFKIEIEKTKLKEYIDLLLNVELDCEIRVVELIKKNKFDLDIDLYTKKGNSYLLFYKKMLQVRKWYDIPPYDIREIWEKMPNQFQKMSLTKELSDLYDKCFNSTNEGMI